MEFNATFLVTIISFLVFVFLMNKILYEPINKIVAERQDFVDGNLRSADENHKKAEAISTQKDEKLKDARSEAKNKYADAVNGFKAQKDSIVTAAKQDTDNELSQEYANLNNLSNEAKAALKGRMNELANDISEKILGYRSEVQGFDDEAVNRILYN